MIEGYIIGIGDGASIHGNMRFSRTLPKSGGSSLCHDCGNVSVYGRQKFCGECAEKRKREKNRLYAQKRRNSRKVG